jgi:hypothetical protein
VPGDLSVTNVGWSQPWISVSGVGLDANNFGTYRISIDRSGLTEGQYSAVFVAEASDNISTDLDNDNIVCDAGELCEFYPNNTEAQGVVISNADVNLGTFRMGFPTPNLSSSGQSSSAVVNSMSADNISTSATSVQSRVSARRKPN